MLARKAIRVRRRLRGGGGTVAVLPLAPVVAAGAAAPTTALANCPYMQARARAASYNRDKPKG